MVRCKVCDYKSVRFDPFTFLSLPLPMESTVNLEIVGEYSSCGGGDNTHLPTVPLQKSPILAPTTVEQLLTVESHLVVTSVREPPSM